MQNQGITLIYSLLPKYTLPLVPKLELSALPLSSDARDCDAHHFLVMPINVLTYWFLITGSLCLVTLKPCIQSWTVKHDDAKDRKRKCCQ